MQWTRKSGIITGLVERQEQIRRERQREELKLAKDKALTVLKGNHIAQEETKEVLKLARYMEEDARSLKIKL